MNNLEELLYCIKTLFEETPLQVTLQRKQMPIAISALEKQTLKKVTEEKCIHEDWESCNDCENVSNCSLGDKCPCCNNNLDYDCGEKYNYCPDCGQKLDWSVEDE